MSDKKGFEESSFSTSKPSTLGKARSSRMTSKSRVWSSVFKASSPSETTVT